MSDTIVVRYPFGLLTELRRSIAAVIAACDAGRLSEADQRRILALAREPSPMSQERIATLVALIGEIVEGAA
jgi:hypothetical protein